MSPPTGALGGDREDRGDDKNHINTSLNNITPILETAVKTAAHNGMQQTRRCMVSVIREGTKMRETHHALGLGFVLGNQPGSSL